ncbi:MAG TPA: PAC2 family protein [Jiangellaceae bacterium]|nr:PAC2 family protein [Jiangellaceae bacterium]
MINPSDLYEIVDESGLPDAPVLVLGLSGYVDAGHAGSGLVDQFRTALDHRIVARFDADLLVDYRARRPRISFVEDHFEEYEAPEIVLRAMTDVTGRQFLLLDGPEPDGMWDRFTTAVTELIQHFGVRLVVGMHGIPMAVPHTRPLGMTVHANRPELVSVVNPWQGKVSVPSNLAALLELRLATIGVDSVGYVAHVPHYLAESEYPDASLSLATALGQATGLELPVVALTESAEATRAMVAEQVSENEEVQRVVGALEVQYDAYIGGEERGNLIAESSAVPDAEQIGDELERFLAGLPGEDGGSGPGTS